MLILARKRQESVVVGGASSAEQMLKVTVIDITGSTVRLGFEADKSVAVHRHEVWERIRAENDAPLSEQVARQRKERMSGRDRRPQRG
jgi:carbon storage regulator